MEPKNGGLEDDFPFQLGDRFHVKFSRVYIKANQSQEKLLDLQPVGTTYPSNTHGSGNGQFRGDLISF